MTTLTSSGVERLFRKKSGILTALDPIRRLRWWFLTKGILKSLWLGMHGFVKVRTIGIVFYLETEK